jgi:hypothetical protein
MEYVDHLAFPEVNKGGGAAGLKITNQTRHRLN